MTCASCGDALTANDAGTCLACDTAHPAPCRPFVFTSTLAAVLAAGRPVRVASWRRFPVDP